MNVEMPGVLLGAMTRRRGLMAWLIVLVLPHAAAMGDVAVDCPVSRMTVSMWEARGNVVAAISFTYGEYGENSATGCQVQEALAGLDVSDRWQVPEYVIIKRLEFAQVGDGESLYGLWEEEYSRGKVLKGAPISEDKVKKMQRLQSRYSHVEFLAKSYFGPYVRIDYNLTPKDQSHKKAPMSAYLRRIGDRYWLTKEITGANVFTTVVESYQKVKRSGGAIRRVSEQEVEAMAWVAFAPALSEPPNLRDRKLTRTLSNGRRWSQAKDTAPLSDNCLVLYHSFQPAGYQIRAGLTPENAVPEALFIEEVLGVYESRNEEAIVAAWCEQDRGSAARNIQQLKSSGEWSRTSRCPFSSQPRIKALLRVPSGTLVFFQMDGRATSPMLLSLRKKVGGGYELARRLRDPVGMWEPFHAWGVLTAICEQY